MRTSTGEVLIELDRSRPRGLRAQVEDQLRDGIRNGRLAPGTLLPSTRALAADLGITRGVVVDAYDQLLAEGYLASRPGSGTVVSASADRRNEAGRAGKPERQAVDIDFRPGLPDLDLFPRTAWLRATKTALQTMPSADLGYIDPKGLLDLRHALAAYLGRVRGVCTDAHHIVVCNGFAHGLALTSQALRRNGIETLAVENPGYGDSRTELDWLGVPFKGVEVDAEGIVVDELARTRARAVLVTPAHQSPTGAVLSPARRTALVEWARRVDAYVIEDDYDAEYRYDRHPVGALQGVAPERVVYSGTVSKSLAPGLRLGWLLVPEPLLAAVVTARWVTDHTTSALTQATYAAFLAHGDLDRHLRRMRRVYRQRRDALIEALARELPDATPAGAAAGLHVLVILPDDVDENAVAEQALAAGVRVYPLDQYRMGRRPKPPPPPALVLGYGSLAPAQSQEGVRRLAQVVSRVRKPA